MLKYNNYIFAESIQQAYELNKKRNNVIIAGGGWLKLGSKSFGSVIDLSMLGLDKITENESEFEIGAMVSLRELETNEALNAYTNGALRESLRHIVGVQFRNCVTVGGSLYGRFGFSDVLSLFLGTDCYVKLYEGGVLPLSEFAKMKYDNDILEGIVVKKTPVKLAYSSFRNQSTDFPVVTCCVGLYENDVKTVVGARPARADVVGDEKCILTDLRERLFKGEETDEAAAKAAAEEYAAYAAERFTYSGNMRASGEYRRQLAEVLIKRTVLEIVKG